MSEQYPYQSIEHSLPVFVVSGHAAHGLQWHLNSGEDFGNLRDDILDEIEAGDEILTDAIDEFIIGWELDEEQSDRFVDGFAVAYKLLAFQAEMADGELPRINPKVAESFNALLGPGVAWQDSNDYYKQRAQYFQQHGKDFASGITEHVKDLDLTIVEAKFFILGAFAVHDLLAQQVLANKAIDERRQAIN
jgi:hypothetical protein